MPADRAQATQGVGKVPKPIPASLWDTPARKLGKALSKMASRQNRVRDQASHSIKQQTARPHTVYADGSVTRPVRVEFHCQTRCEYHSWRQCSLYGLNFQLDNGGGSSHHALRWIASRGDSQTVQSIILTDSMNLLQKVKSGMGSPD